VKLIPKEVNINRFPNLDKFKQKHVDVEQAIKRYIKPGDRIVKFGQNQREKIGAPLSTSHYQ